VVDGPSVIECIYLIENKLTSFQTKNITIRLTITTELQRKIIVKYKLMIVNEVHST